MLMVFNKNVQNVTKYPSFNLNVHFYFTDVFLSTVYSLSLQQHAFGDKIFVCCTEGVVLRRIWIFGIHQLLLL